jgi:hypothetical protein
VLATAADTYTVVIPYKPCTTHVGWLPLQTRLHVEWTSGSVRVGCCHMCSTLRTSFCSYLLYYLAGLHLMRAEPMGAAVWHQCQRQAALCTACLPCWLALPLLHMHVGSSVCAVREALLHGRRAAHSCGATEAHSILSVRYTLLHLVCRGNSHCGASGLFSP